MKRKMFMDWPPWPLTLGWKENEKVMRKDMIAAAAEMLEASGFKNVSTYDNADNIGLGIHEMGTARMGKDPKTSVLNAWNQVHEAPNVFVTDGAAMTSSGCQNPSLTYMALTARAANHAVEELKKGMCNEINCDYHEQKRGNSKTVLTWATPFRRPLRWA